MRSAALDDLPDSMAGVLCRPLKVAVARAEGSRYRSEWHEGI
jgi:hypothetical protein